MKLLQLKFMLKCKGWMKSFAVGNAPLCSQLSSSSFSITNHREKGNFRAKLLLFPHPKTTIKLFYLFARTRMKMLPVISPAWLAFATENFQMKFINMLRSTLRIHGHIAVLLPVEVSVREEEEQGMARGAGKVFVELKFHVKFNERGERKLHVTSYHGQVEIKKTVNYETTSERSTLCNKSEKYFATFEISCNFLPLFPATRKFKSLHVLCRSKFSNMKLLHLKF